MVVFESGTWLSGLIRPRGDCNGGIECSLGMRRKERITVRLSDWSIETVILHYWARKREFAEG